MPLIIITGMPCSGKSYYAQLLKNYFEQNVVAKNVILVSDEDYLLKNDRNIVFKDSSKEKQMRSFLKSTVQRNLLPGNLVILDSSNYIKGYRYEFYCLTKELKSTHCLLQCIKHKNESLDYNNTRKPDRKYNNEIFDSLILRYEDPMPSNRWDYPLFNTINNDFDELCLQIKQALFEKKPPLPNQSTNPVALSDTNFVFSMDYKTREISNYIIKMQDFDNLSNIDIPGSKIKLNLHKKLSLIELNKLRRQFISYTKSHPIQEELIPNSFVQYLNSN